LKGLYKIEAVHGQLYVYEDRLVIKRDGYNAKLTHGLKGDKTIFLKNIVSVEYKKAGRFIVGFLQFGIKGGMESKGGLMDATKDENTVTFKSEHNATAEKIKKYIESYEPPKEMPVGINQLSAADEIMKFKQLLDNGIITQEQFEEQKSKLLK
jgi:hypothetical protein